MIKLSSIARMVIAHECFGNPIPREAYELIDAVEKAISELENRVSVDKTQQSVWNGEGSPPVGTECEALYGLVWHPCVVVTHYDGFVFAWNYEHRITFTFDDIEIAAGEHLRPARTEADRKREEIMKLMRQLVTNYNKTDVLHAIEEIYDAIAAGKIPGVKMIED